MHELENRVAELERVLEDLLECFDDNTIETASGGCAFVSEYVMGVVDRAEDTLFRGEDQDASD